MKKIKRKYWWVSHSKTYKFQTNANHLWSPKTAKNGNSLHSYDNMPKINSGDVIFSYADQKIGFIGVATGGVYSSIKPKEYPKSWSSDGYKVPVSFYKLGSPFLIKSLNVNDVNLLASLLSKKHSPLRKDGDMLKGAESYLSQVTEEFSTELIKIIGESEFNSILADHVSPEEEGKNRQREAQDANLSTGSDLIRKIENKKGRQQGKNKRPAYNPPSRPSYDRCEYVKKYVYERAKGSCELCGQLAPFNSKADYGERPYLDSHHIEWLANGGPDTIDNSVALCPNCHMKMHHNANSKSLEKDIKNLRKLYKFHSKEDELKYRELY
jgi:5-methylcytosine-specific restriction endonuclease McrA